VGFLIEGHIQYSFMNIKQIEKFYSRFYPKWKSEAYWELMSKLNVLDAQPLYKMSCGQRSQVALGLLLAQDPDLLILDDYSMGLDAGYRRLFLDYLKEFAKDSNKTVFITSHIIQDLENFLDDCVILDYNGVVLSMPINEFKASFKQYKFRSSDNIEFNKNDIIKNFEKLKDTYFVYSFSDIEEVKNYLNKQGISFTDFEEVPMDLEDAFIGITGKY
jgi:ABC-2 type transport system ATP-binding protein